MRREDTASGRDGEGANLRSPDATHPVNQYPSPRRPLARSPSRPLAASVLLFGFFLLPFAFAQSGRQTPPPPKPPSQSQGGRSVSPKADESRPRRAIEESQDDKPLKLKVYLVNVIISVTDSTGNQINHLTQKYFEM